MQEIANNLWQTPGVTGIAISQANSKIHLFTKRRVAEWEKEAISKIIASKIAEYAVNPEISPFKVMGNYAHLYLQYPFPPLVVLAQFEVLQLPDLADLSLGIQQDCLGAIAIFEQAAKNELIRTTQKLTSSKSIGENNQNPLAENMTIQELVTALDRLINFCSKYLGQSMTLKYLEKNRPDDVWLSKFEIDKSLKIIFKGNLNEQLTPSQKSKIREWIKNFIKEFSSIFSYLPGLIEKNALSGREKSILIS